MPIKNGLPVSGLSCADGIFLGWRAAKALALDSAPV